MVYRQIREELENHLVAGTIPNFSSTINFQEYFKVTKADNDVQIR
jgi:hypothetical protein